MSSTAYKGPSRLIAAGRWRIRLLAGVTMALLLLAMGCYNNNTGEANIGGSINFTLPAFPETGGNVAEIFTEMHFQPSYREGEIPRLLPPVGSVPITGAEVIPETADGYSGFDVPTQVFENYDHADAQRLYTVNCQVCHGVSLQGDGPITTLMSADGTLAYDKAPFPANLKAAVTIQATDGDLFGFISGGGRQGLSAISRGRESSSPMPPFNKLLKVEDRWALVLYLRTQIGR